METINLCVVFAILILHWVFDFVLQTDKQAQGKSSSWFFLISHTGQYSLSWLPVAMIYMAATKNVSILLFVPITFVCHTATDFYTSRVNKALWEEKNVHGFFVSVGFDQLLHYFQLLITYQLLK